MTSNGTKSSVPGLHHCSWDVPSVQDIGLGAMHMANSGYSKGWGPEPPEDFAFNHEASAEPQLPGGIMN